jgi:hypothetical protein
MRTTTMHSGSRKARGRASQRGAALVEAAVVIPVMLVFLGCIVFAHRSYTAKMDKQMGTRAGSLYYASHNCTGEVPADIVPPVSQAGENGADVPAGQGVDANKLGGENGGAAAAGMNTSWLLVHAKPEATPVYGSAVSNGQRIFLNRQIYAESEVACNEKPHPNKWTAMFQFIGDMARGGGKI